MKTTTGCLSVPAAWGFDKDDPQQVLHERVSESALVTRTEIFTDIHGNDFYRIWYRTR